MNEDHRPGLVAAYVSGHGFGHAVRTSVILGELIRELPRARIIVKTDAPSWLFAGLGPDVEVLPARVDAPPVQADAFSLDIDRTLTTMRKWLQHKDGWIRREASWLREHGVSLVLADISPLALTAAYQARVPSALVANFTWEWILQNAELCHPLVSTLAGEWAAFTPLASWCFCTFPSADIAHPHSITVGLVGRRCGRDRDDLRRQLGLAPDDIGVLLSFGGLGVSQADFAPLARLEQVVFLSTSPRPGLSGCRRLGRETDHACLVRAADVVVGKLGYSTVAEALIHGTPFLFAPRSHWPEERILREAVEKLIPCACVPWERFIAGQWSEDLLSLAGAGRADEQIAYGGAQVARFLSAALRDDALDTPDLYPSRDALTVRRHETASEVNPAVSGSCLGV